jgi:hypothetical protein
VQGDSVWDAPRILRVPGTTNRKDPDLPVPVRLVLWDVDRRYRIRDFDDLIPRALDGPPPLGVGTWLFPREGDLPIWLQDLIAEGAPKGERSEACFKVVLYLLRYGWTDEQILDVFESNPEGIGDKFRERSNGPRWLARTIKAARRMV